MFDFVEDVDTAPCKWQEVAVKPLGGCEYPYNHHGENKNKESWSSSTSKSHDSYDGSHDDEGVNEWERDRARRVRVRMREISSTEREHIGASPAGFHIKSAAVVVTIDSNSSSSSSSRGRNEPNISRDYGSKDRNNDSRTSSPSPRNMNMKKKTSSRTSTDDDVSVSPTEGASLGGTGLKVTMKKLSGRMYFAATRNRTFNENCLNENASVGAGKYEDEQQNKEKESSRSGSRSGRDGSVALLEYPLFDMKSDMDHLDFITVSSNVANSSIYSEAGGVHGKGTESGGAPTLSAPVIPFKDIFYFNAHLIDLGEPQNDMTFLSHLTFFSLNNHFLHLIYSFLFHISYF